MKILILVLGLIAGLLLESRGQNGYSISGRVRGLQSNQVYVVAADFGRADTLSSAKVENGGFLLSGNLRSGVRAVKLVFAGVEGELPLLLENIPYQVSVTPQGGAIEGEGPASKLLKEFERIGNEYAAEQNRIALELESSSNANEAQLQNLRMLADKAYRESVSRMHELLRANADNYVSAYVIALGMNADDESSLRAKYDLLGEPAKATAPGQAVATVLTRYDQLGIGEMAPDFTLSKPDGNTFALHSVPAKWKLIHFWASTNPIARRLNPDLVRLYLQYRPKGLEIVSVSLDTDRFAWRKAVGTDGLTWTNGSDLQDLGSSEIARLYLVSELPSLVLLDAENRIVARDLSLADLRARLAELTKKKKKK